MDAIADSSFLSRVIGKTITITLTYGTFQGVLMHVDPSRTILISKVKDLGTGRTLPGAKLFFGHDIVNVELQSKAEGASEQVFEGQATGERENISSEENFAEARKPDAEHRETRAPTCQKSCTVSLQAIKRAVDEEEVEFTVINQFQPMFGPAIRHIRSQTVLGLAAAGLNLCRHGKLCWLQVATKSRVYLFDILVLGPKVFKNGLQMVLDDNSVLKVIHDCRWLADCLSHQYGTVLSNVFDTQVADVFLFSMDTGGFLPNRTSTLDECLKRHLNMLPSRVSFLTHRQKLVKEDPRVWFARPMPPPLLKVLVLEVVHLLPLRLAMLDGMLADFTSLVDGYLNAYRKGTADALGSTEFACSELPVELQQLRVLQSVRRERAMAEFKVNEKGFLSRPGDTQETREADQSEESPRRRAEPDALSMQDAASGGFCNLPFWALKKPPQCPEIGTPYLSGVSEDLGLLLTPRPEQKPVLPFPSPMGLRMTAPQLLAKTFHKAT
ncbi:piRNA biogenesis protein EXD1 [Ascaphus truei]|uniref:piRNA biogenesis protein EXD1 n=1 Tax=Ascaphus truei TaxID=8439 RepID=UPI003F5A3505